MIYSVSADKESFNKITFNPGFNVILAERTRDSTIKDSRNGVGKSTLIEIINFCLGANRGDTLKKSELDNWTFTIEIDLSGKKYSISRNTSNNDIIINGDCSDWPIQPKYDDKEKKQIMSKNNWNIVLGILMFDLKQSSENYVYVPTFRSMISYFIRRSGSAGGFLDPFSQYKNQLEWDKQVNNAYLLGLGWEYASKWQILKDRVKVLSQLKKESESGIISDMMGNLGELESLKIRLEAQINKEKEELDNFKVLPQYEAIETEANQITEKIHELVEENISEKRLLEYYESTLNQEIDTNKQEILNVYKEAGILFSENITKKIDDVFNFHKTVINNRKNFLNTEIQNVKYNLEKRETEIKILTEKRTELMTILKTHGALKEYSNLQNNHQAMVAKLKDINIKLENLSKFEQGKNSVVIDEALLKQQATNDLLERKKQKEDAVLTFNNYSNELYETPGTLSINVEKTGFKFDVDIKRSGSYGIGNMKIFCYDLMLAKLWSKKTKTSFFLLHDSVLFADVDERQKALALQLAEKESKTHGFQYICTLNSDGVPRKDFRDDFNFDSYIVKTLTDKNEKDSILGIRF